MDDAVALAFIIVFAAFAFATGFTALLLVAGMLTAYGLMILSAAIYRAFGGKDWRDGAH